MLFLFPPSHLSPHADADTQRPQELESLLEKDIITGDAYQSIHALLPAEASLSSAAAAPTTVAAKTAASPPSLANLSLHNNNHNPAPPSYAQTTTAAPPALPSRNTPQPPPAPPSKPVIAHARALYRYAAGDARDLSFERDDRVAVYEFMNADWWMGRCERTGQEGIFPRSYVEQLPDAPAYNNNNNGYAPPPTSAAYGEKAGMYGSPAPGQPQYGGYPPPAPQQQNPYDSAAPPMAVANEPQQQGQGGGKAGEMGKKFGKKLGNAAIFGAGASIGSNIVNSIF